MMDKEIEARFKNINATLELNDKLFKDIQKELKNLEERLDIQEKAIIEMGKNIVEIANANVKVKK